MSREMTADERSDHSWCDHWRVEHDGRVKALAEVKHLEMAYRTLLAVNNKYRMALVEIIRRGPMEDDFGHPCTCEAIANEALPKGDT